MKKVVFAAGFVACLVVASSAYADPIADVVVGAYDVKDDCGPLTLPSCEEAKLEEKLGGDYGSFVKIDTTQGAGWSYVSGSTTLATFDLSKFGLQSPIKYFVVKFGNAVD